MRVTCPQCSTEYDVPDTALAAGSRRLRCDRCGHEWRQEAPAAAPEMAPQPVQPEPEPFVAPEILKPERVTPENVPKFLNRRDPQSDQVEGSERRRGIGVESQQRRPTRNGRGSRGRILLLLALIVIAVVFFVYRSF